ncbi:hypothetical protein D3C75_977320 [compost metagenome]
MSDQGQVRRENHAGDHRHHGGAEGTQQVQDQDGADVGFLPVFVVGDRSHDQDEHQNRRNGFEGRDEQFADEGQLQGGSGEQQRQGNTGNQADNDLHHQAGAVEQVHDGV